jgi:hypothetical protein
MERIMSLVFQQWWGIEIMLVKEVATIKPRKPLTPQQQRINTLQQQVKRSQEAVKAERQRQRIAKAQAQLVRAHQITPQQG